MPSRPRDHFGGVSFGGVRCSKPTLYVHLVLYILGPQIRCRRPIIPQIFEISSHERISRFITSAAVLVNRSAILKMTGYKLVFLGLLGVVR
jgi:hypothetical protein